MDYDRIKQIASDFYNAAEQWWNYWLSYGTYSMEVAEALAKGVSSGGAFQHDRDKRDRKELGVMEWEPRLREQLTLLTAAAEAIHMPTGPLEKLAGDEMQEMWVYPSYDPRRERWSEIREAVADAITEAQNLARAIHERATQEKEKASLMAPPAALPPAVPRGEQTDETKDGPAAAPPAPPAVVLQGRGNPILVRGVRKQAVSDATYDVLEALLNAPDQRLSKPALERASKRTEPQKFLARLAKSDADWRAVIHMAGKAGRKYRIGYAQD